MKKRNVVPVLILASFAAPSFAASPVDMIKGKAISISRSFEGFGSRIKSAFGASKTPSLKYSAKELQTAQANLEKLKPAPQTLKVSAEELKVIQANLNKMAPTPSPTYTLEAAEKRLAASLEAAQAAGKGSIGDHLEAELALGQIRAAIAEMKTGEKAPAIQLTKKEARHLQTKLLDKVHNPENKKMTQEEINALTAYANKLESFLVQVINSKTSAPTFKDIVEGQLFVGNLRAKLGAAQTYINIKNLRKKATEDSTTSAAPQVATRTAAKPYPVLRVIHLDNESENDNPNAYSEIKAGLASKASK